MALDARLLLYPTGAAASGLHRRNGWPKPARALEVSRQVIRDHWKPVSSASQQPEVRCVQVRRTDETLVHLVQPTVKVPFMHHCHTRHFTRIVEANFQELLWVPGADQIAPEPPFIQAAKSPYLSDDKQLTWHFFCSGSPTYQKQMRQILRPILICMVHTTTIFSYLWRPSLRPYASCIHRVCCPS